MAEQSSTPSNERSKKFRKALYKISKQLSEDDINDLKDLVGGLEGNPGFGDLENVKSGFKIFMLLFKTDRISEDNYEYLEELLEIISQNALLKKFRDLMKDDGDISDSQRSASESSPTSPPITEPRYSTDISITQSPVTSFATPKQNITPPRDSSCSSSSPEITSSYHQPISPRPDATIIPSPNSDYKPNPRHISSPNVGSPLNNSSNHNSRPISNVSASTVPNSNLTSPSPNTSSSPRPNTSPNSRPNTSSIPRLNTSPSPSPNTSPSSRPNTSPSVRPSPDGSMKSPGSASDGQVTIKSRSIEDVPGTSPKSSMIHPTVSNPFVKPMVMLQSREQAVKSLNQSRHQGEAPVVTGSHQSKMDVSGSPRGNVPSPSTGAVPKVDRHTQPPIHPTPGMLPDTSGSDRFDNASSFGYNQLISTDLPGLARPCNLREASHHNQDDITGPTLELTSSVSSLGISSSKAPVDNVQRMTDNKQDGNQFLNRQGISRECHSGLKQDERSIDQDHLGGSVKSARQTPVSGRPSDADLETDAPDDEKKGAVSSQAIGSWSEKPSDTSLYPLSASTQQNAAIFQAFAPRLEDHQALFPTESQDVFAPYKNMVTESSLFPSNLPLSDEMPLPQYGWSQPISNHANITEQYTGMDDRSSGHRFGPVGSDAVHRKDAYFRRSPNKPDSLIDDNAGSYGLSRRTISTNAASASSMYQTGAQMQQFPTEPSPTLQEPSTRSHDYVSSPTAKKDDNKRYPTQSGTMRNSSQDMQPVSVTDVSKHPVQSSPYQQRATGNPHRKQNDRILELKQQVADSVAKARQTQSSRRAPSGANRSEDQAREGKTLRNYQLELAAPAKLGGNYIICAPTGSGKTLTAASICRHFHDRAKENGTRFKALFIVNIRHLTQQQTNVFRDTFPRGTVGTIGETEYLHAVFFEPDYAVVMVTAQILVNALKKSPNPDLTLGDISMIIFDECHHTTQDHPYNEIMKMYLKTKKALVGDRRRIGESGPSLPQIIGLSASLGVGHGKDAYRHVLTLCGNMDAKNVTQVRTHINELDTHVNSPEQDLILTVLCRHTEKRDLGHIINDIMHQIEGQFVTEWLCPTHATQMYEQWVVEARKDAEVNSGRDRLIACLYLFEYNRALMFYEDLRAIDSLRHIETFIAQRDMGHRMRPIEELCREYFRAEHTEMKRICREETDAHNPKLEKLAMLLRQKFMDKPHSKGIVLTRMRQATIALVEFINQTTLLRGLPVRVTPIRLVGQGELDNFFMTESEQKMALDRFRKDESCNLLVATDIAQEGLDMPACNFVIRYNFVSNEIGTVQSKGRARAEQSECYLIVEEGSQNAVREIENRQKVINMKVAMDKLNNKSDAERLKDITERQDEIYKDIEEKEKMKKIAKGIHDSAAVEILCKECNAYITLGSYMRKKGSHFTCVDPRIQERVLIVNDIVRAFRDTRNVGTFKCANRTCGQSLGIAVHFLDGQTIEHKGYGFKMKGLLFKLPDGTKTPFKQWTKVTFDIPDL